MQTLVDTELKCKLLIITKVIVYDEKVTLLKLRLEGEAQLNPLRGKKADQTDELLGFSFNH